MDKYEQLEKLAKLKEDGILSEEEFLKEKEKILNPDKNIAVNELKKEESKIVKKIPINKNKFKMIILGVIALLVIGMIIPFVVLNFSKTNVTESSKNNSETIVSSDKKNVIEEVKKEQNTYLNVDLLKINEFYIGMSIDEALNLLNNKYNFKPIPPSFGNVKCFENNKILETDGKLSIKGSEKSDLGEGCNEVEVIGDLGSYTFPLFEIEADKENRKVTYIYFAEDTNNNLVTFKKLFKTEDYNQIAKIIEGANNIKLKKDKQTYTIVDKYNMILVLTENGVFIRNDAKLYFNEKKEAEIEAKKREKEYFKMLEELDK